MSNYLINILINQTCYVYLAIYQYIVEFAVTTHFKWSKKCNSVNG